MMTPDLKSIIHEVVDQCDTCIRKQPPKPKPAVGLPKSDSFNQTVSMDLHEILPQKLWYLHMVDEFTRFSNACFIKTKTAVPQSFMRNWIQIFGPPKKIFTDNGGEFIGESIYDLCAAFNIKQGATPAYSPFSNGGCEKQNHILTKMLHKVKDGQNCSWETALSWAVCAKNQLINVQGFSPAQLVFGQNGNFPSVMNSSLPGLEDIPESSVAALHVASMHLARQAFMEVESCQKIKLALKKQLRLPSQPSYEIGDSVYYHRDLGGKVVDKWRGPAKVIGRDGQALILRHGSRVVTAHIHRVSPVKLIEANVESQPQLAIAISDDELLYINPCHGI